MRPFDPLQRAPIPQVGAGDTALEAGTAYRAWLIHFADRDPVQSYCTPPATHTEILASHPDAIAAEPIKEAIPDEAAPEFREQYAHAREDVPEEEKADGMITCRQCANRRYDGVCKVAEPKVGALIVANHGYIPDALIPRRCEGYQPKAGETDQRTGMQRWRWLKEVSHEL